MKRLSTAWVAGALLLASACAGEPIRGRPGYADDVAAVVRRVDAARAARRQPPSAPLYRLAPDMDRLAASVERGDARDPRWMLQDILKKGGESLNGGTAFAWMGFAERLDKLAVPDMLASAQTLRLAVGVARCQTPEMPNGGYCVLVAAIQIMGPIGGGGPGGG